MLDWNGNMRRTENGPLDGTGRMNHSHKREAEVCVKGTRAENLY